MTITRRQFIGCRLTERPDGSAVLLVRSLRGKRMLDYEIHLAPHVVQDIGFLFYQQFSHGQTVRKKRL